ncbi:hypothetical protein JCGZ_20974 [Jatropha curcas]|uniref:Uncharacterized protein n=1 Tax=Jatropha curcas TaxID=180498 RepID=A0A067K5E6_JATCU|nr:hypothetical protein JCGZ_20974 [Jatropha curcas]
MAAYRDNSLLRDEILGSVNNMTEEKSVSFTPMKTYARRRKISRTEKEEPATETDHICSSSCLKDDLAHNICSSKFLQQNLPHNICSRLFLRRNLPHNICFSAIPMKE